jgi:periplasmic protein TonB
MSAYAQVRDSGYYTRRTIVAAVAIGLQLLMLFGLASGLVQKAVDKLAEPIKAEIVEEAPNQDEPPPPPPPEMERPPVELPPPVIDIQLAADAPVTNAITDVTDKPVPVAPPPAPVARQPVTTPVKLDLKRSPSTDDFYPESSRRNGDVGVVQIRACSSPDGRTAGEATVAQSSGFPKLDEAAVKWARRARWIAATEDGKPVQACSSFNVRFKFTD